MAGLEYLSLFSSPLHSVVNCHKVKNKNPSTKNGMHFTASKNNQLPRQIGTFTGSEN